MGRESFISVTGPGSRITYTYTIRMVFLDLYLNSFHRFEGSFKKGYPNGQGTVKLGNNSVLWEGTFTNGAPDQQVGEHLQRLFTHFHTYPLRMKTSLRWR